MEVQAGSTREAAAALAPLVEDARIAADGAAAKIGEAEAGIARQREALDALLLRLDEGVAGAETQLQKLGAAAGEAEGAAAKIVADTGPELIEALLRVREAAAQAAEKAREAIAAVIPTSAAALADASRQALGEAVNETVQEQMTELAELSRRSMAAARDASERLTRQMLASASLPRRSRSGSNRRGRSARSRRARISRGASPC